MLGREDGNGRGRDWLVGMTVTRRGRGRSVGMETHREVMWIERTRNTE